MDKLHIVMAADEPYMKGLEVAKASMIASCSNPARLEFHIFGENPSLDARIRNEFGTYKGSSMAFLRLYLGELLPNVDWIVYSDVDTLWYRDVLELSKLFDSAKTIQWVRDLPGTAFEFTQWCNAHGVPSRDFRPENYCCSGICIINLTLWRERNVLRRCHEFIAKYGCPKYADQDILNAVLANEAGMLPDWWDVLIPSPKNTPRCVMHLTGVGRCFERPYGGKVVQYRYWEHVARNKPFTSTWTLPFYMHRWMIRLCLPFSNVILHDRIQRYFAWRWFLKHEIFAHAQCISNHHFLGLPAAKPRGKDESWFKSQVKRLLGADA